MHESVWCGAGREVCYCHKRSRRFPKERARTQMLAVSAGMIGRYIDKPATLMTFEFVFPMEQASCST